MPVVDIVIHHKAYQVVCGDGQEDHLRLLATKFNVRMEEMSLQMGKGSYSMIMLMSALMLEDELSEAQGQVKKLQEGTADALDVVGADKLANISLEAEKKAVAQANVALSNAISGVSDYIENITQKLDVTENA